MHRFHRIAHHYGSNNSLWTTPLNSAAECCASGKTASTVSNHADPAEIVQEKDAPSKQYYVHYLTFNKRLDHWVQPQELALLPPNGGNEAAPVVTWFQKRCREEAAPRPSERSKVRNLERLVLGRYEIQPWYYSPYLPNHYHLSKLYVCEFCLKYMRRGGTYKDHVKKCTVKRPPGPMIYRESLNVGKVRSISVFEVAAHEHKLYCQSLCLLAKLFLDHKALYYFVASFNFYVLTEDHSKYSRVVGYFSKETGNEEHNLACILVLPPYQQRGYGKFLIALSYELSQREKRVGTPERPLSNMGRASYRSYWTEAVLKLIWQRGPLGLSEISRETSIAMNDIVETLNSLSMLKYWKGQYVLKNVNPQFFEDYFRKKAEKRKQIVTTHVQFNPKLLVTKPS